MNLEQFILIITFKYRKYNKQVELLLIKE